MLALFVGFSILFFIVLPVLHNRRVSMIRCPECEADEMVDHGDYIECDFCGAQFDIDSEYDDPIPYEEEEEE
jgi:hypothetical protein